MKQQYRHPVYIWQQEQWPRFRWDAEALTEPLARVNRAIGELNGRISALGFDSKATAQLDALSREIGSSSQIENVSLNMDSVRSSMARRLGLESGALAPEDHYVEGLVDVMLDAVRNADEPLTAERLFNWHAALFPSGRSGMTHITVADWRRGEEPMQVVSGALGKQRVHYEAPPSSQVPEMMAEFLDWVRTASLEPVLKAALSHLWFVSVHPFDDGNGRLSRTVADYVLARGDRGHQRYFSMSAEILRLKRDYYRILERTQQGDLDVTQWVLWFVSCLESAVRRASEVVDTTMQKALFWERFADTDVNERQRKVLNRLWDGFDGNLTTSKWAKICHTSQDTALRDIRDLLAKGMLRQAPSGGRSTHYLLPD